MTVVYIKLTYYNNYTASREIHNEASGTLHSVIMSKAKTLDTEQLTSHKEGNL